MGAPNRQTAQKRHTDPARRRRPPSVDTPAAQPGPQAQEASHHHSIPPAKALVSDGALPKSTRKPPPGSAGVSDPVPGSLACSRAPVEAQPATARGRPATPRITAAVIAEGLYELARAPDHAETRAWHVLVGVMLAGLVRPTWRGERSRPGWEPVDTAGTALPATGIGRTTPAGNARTPRRRRSQPAARPAAPAGTGEEEFRPLKGAASHAG